MIYGPSASISKTMVTNFPQVLSQAMDSVAGDAVPGEALVVEAAAGAVKLHTFASAIPAVHRLQWGKAKPGK